MQVNRQKFSSFLQKLIFVNFNLLFFLTPFIFTWMNQELFEFNKMLFVYAITIFIVSLWLIRMVVEQKLIVKRSKLDYFLLAFLISQIISTVFSLHTRTSWFGYYTRFNGGLLSTVTYIAIFYAFISNIKKSQLKAIYSSLLLSALLISLYAIPERLGHSPSCWLIKQKFDTSCWTETNNPRFRVFATFGQPNWLAAFLISIIPLNLSYLLKEKKFLSRLYLLLVLLSSGTALILTKSRSGLLGLALGLVFYGLFKFIINKKERLVIFFKLSGLAIALLAVAFFIGTPSTTKIGEVITQPDLSPSSQVQEGGTPSEEIRKIVWQGAIKVWQRYPIFGSGVETFAYSYYLDRPLAHNLVSEWDFLYNKAHNELLNLLANSGIVGLLSYLSIFVGIFYIGINNSFDNKHRDKILALLAGILAMFVSNFFGFSTVTSNLLLFGFFAIIVLHTSQKNITNLAQEKKIEKQNYFGNKEYIFCSIILITMVIFLNKVRLIWQADYLFTKGQELFEKKGNYQTGLPLIQEAIKKSPKEALFYDELAGDYADLSIAFANDNQSTASALLAQKAIESNQYALQLNPAHLNFYKSQARIFIKLGQLDSKLYSYAEQALKKAISLAPTDAKLYYNLALILEVIQKNDEALANMEYAVSIKGNYLQARNELARMYFLRGNFQKAKEQYVFNLKNIAPNDELLKEKLQVVEASISAQTK